MNSNTARRVSLLCKVFFATSTLVTGIILILFGALSTPFAWFSIMWLAVGIGTSISVVLHVFMDRRRAKCPPPQLTTDH